MQSGKNGAFEHGERLESAPFEFVLVAIKLAILRVNVLPFPWECHSFLITSVYCRRLGSVYSITRPGSCSRQTEKVCQDVSTLLQKVLRPFLLPGGQAVGGQLHAPLFKSDQSCSTSAQPRSLVLTRRPLTQRSAITCDMRRFWVSMHISAGRYQGAIPCGGNEGLMGR